MDKDKNSKRDAIYMRRPNQDYSPVSRLKIELQGFHLLRVHSLSQDLLWEEREPTGGS